ncbi:MAG: ABC transporter permease [Candidatus Amulumruptor caecigallinarius]|nr:ABC transporter permease [Candidatus Amulumruptor caecigallinarius]
MKRHSSRLISGLLHKNISKSRIAGFVISNFIGLAIVAVAVQFYMDARSIWTDSHSFIKSDYLVVNKRVTSANTMGQKSSDFTAAEIADLGSQPWARRVGSFSSTDYRVLASVNSGSRGMSTYMFFESIPDEFVDVPRSQWEYRPGSDVVPIILSKDYLTLYNFGFARSAGLPQMSEGLMSSIPLTLRLTSNDGTRSRELHGRVAGYSNRLNTILVPQSFMDETNAALGTGADAHHSRLVVDVSSPGDVAIKQYLEQHDYELAGDKSASSASFLLNVIVAVVTGIGAVITLLSLSILILSLSLIMEKNRDKIHSLLMLGYEFDNLAATYRRLVVYASLAAWVMAVGSMLLMRSQYLEPLSALGARPSGIWVAPVVTLLLTAVTIACNITAINRKIRASWR